MQHIISKLEGKPQTIYTICCQDAGRRVSTGRTNERVGKAIRVKRGKEIDMKAIHERKKETVLTCHYGRDPAHTA
jgi:hypothetical protein